MVSQKLDLRRIDYQTLGRFARLGKMLIVVFTISGSYFYQLIQFLDTTTENPIDGMMYRNNPMHSCGISSMQFIQTTEPRLTFKVCLPLKFCELIAVRNFLQYLY
jgi:hypothetical protein